jgi:cell wall-associated NlpC family hydrolase
MGIETGANCQNVAYELLRYFGRQVPLLRSSNLWDDTEHTIVVDIYQPLDLLLFSRTRNAWGAHVAVYVGNDRAIHLSRRVGLQFMEHPEYRVLLGAKRALTAPSCDAASAASKAADFLLAFLPPAIDSVVAGNEEAA